MFQNSVVSRRNVLVIFARAPQPGQVKTRIAAELGSLEALEIYRTLAAQTIAAARSGTNYCVTVAYSPRDAEGVMRDWLGASLSLRPQRDGDLDARMAATIDDEFARGAHRVVVIGTDCPGLTSTHIENAFARLEKWDVVLGPATDGGYYLIGMTRPLPELFEDVPWSSPETLRVTVERARQRELRISLLEELADIDTADDWRAWLSRQAQRGESALGGTVA
jgi:rSAM/selenodomain-associated transferase 1